MKNWQASDVRWATTSDMSLPMWERWNRDTPLPPNFWQRIWEYPFIASRIPKGAPSLDIGGTYPFVLFKHWPNAKSVDIRELNELDHELHLGLWPREKLIISDATQVPLPDNSVPYAFSISAIEEMPDPLAVLKEMLRLASQRVVITMDISDRLGVSHTELRAVEEFIGREIPPLPRDALTSVSPVIKRFGQRRNPEYRDIRVIGITFDARDEPRSTAILVPHWESWQFLEPCVDSITEHANPSVDQKVYVLDDASRDGSFEKAQAKYGDRDDVRVMRVERPNKEREADVGMLLDIGLGEVEEQYVATIDADLFPISRDWLSFPIWLIEELGLSAAGMDSGLSSGYLGNHPSHSYWQPREGYQPAAGLYDNDWFVCINNLYRVMPTATAKVVSEQIGFRRSSPPPLRQAQERLRQRVSGLLRTDWLDRQYPYIRGAADNGVRANHFIDVNRLGPKFNLPLTGYVGLTPKDGAFGQNISGLVFHFALSTRALSRERREVQDAGPEFALWMKRLEQAGGFNEGILGDMIEASEEIRPGGYDGSVPASFYREQLEYVNHLRARFERERAAV